MDSLNIGKASEKVNNLINNIEKVFIGKREVIIKAVTALLSEGHILLEDVPGVGKTLLARAIARSIQGDLKRIQFTADLLPTDVTGVTVYKQKEEVFEFRKGPVFTNLLLGDEINRATPRTQSSLLEAMEEKQVSVEGDLYPIQTPFFVIATQNPIELEGTYPLPFSQMDRFLVRLRIGYLSFEEEERMLKEQKVSLPIDQIKPVMDCNEIQEIQNTVKHIKVADELYDYIIKIITKTRNSEMVEFGASPRGSLDLMRFSQAIALSKGRDYILPDDIKFSATNVLGHRIIVKKGTRLATSSNDNIIKTIVDSIEVPV